MSERCLPRGSPVQGAGHGESIAPCPGYPTGICAAVEDVTTSPLQPDLPTPGLVGAGSPSRGDAEPLYHSWHRSWLSSLRGSWPGLSQTR